MDLYAEEDYKKYLKYKIKEIQKERPSFTLKKVAPLIPVQYTYLSKALSQGSVHLSEDHLFGLCKLLDVKTVERDFIMNKRAYEVCAHTERKEHLFKKIQQAKAEKLLNTENIQFKKDNLNTEMSYLFNPTIILLHAALYIKRYRENPLHFCDDQKVSINELKEFLKILALNNFIELEDDGLNIKAIKDEQFHLGRNHPLMRVHQSLLKTAIGAHIAKCPEKDKHSFLITFSSDKEAFHKIKEAFGNFLKEVEQIAGASKDENVYQLNFDLFKWL